MLTHHNIFFGSLADGMLPSAPSALFVPAVRALTLDPPVCETPSKHILVLQLINPLRWGRHVLLGQQFSTIPLWLTAYLRAQLVLRAFLMDPNVRLEVPHLSK